MLFYLFVFIFFFCMFGIFVTFCNEFSSILILHFEIPFLRMQFCFLYVSLGISLKIQGKNIFSGIPNFRKSVFPIHKKFHREKMIPFPSISPIVVLIVKKMQGRTCNNWLYEGKKSLDIYLMQTRYVQSDSSCSRHYLK